MDGRNTWGRVVALLTIVVLVVGAMTIAGCGGTKESPGGPKGLGVSEEKKVSDADKEAAFKALDALRAGYNKAYVMMLYGETKDELVIGGTITAPATLGPALRSAGAGTAYSKIVLAKDAKGVWGVKSATKAAAEK